MQRCQFDSRHLPSLKPLLIDWSQGLLPLQLSRSQSFIRHTRSGAAPFHGRRPEGRMEVELETSASVPQRNSMCVHPSRDLSAIQSNPNGIYFASFRFSLVFAAHNRPEGSFFCKFVLSTDNIPDHISLLISNLKFHFRFKYLHNSRNFISRFFTLHQCHLCREWDTRDYNYSWLSFQKHFFQKLIYSVSTNFLNIWPFIFVMKIFCSITGDKHLMQSLAFDAQATEIFDKNVSLSIDRQEP